MFKKSEEPELDLSAVASVTQHTHMWVTTLQSNAPASEVNSIDSVYYIKQKNHPAWRSFPVRENISVLEIESHTALLRELKNP